MAEVLVEGSQRLIEKEQRRVVHDGAGKGHALLLSARELPGEAVLKPGELHQGDHVLDPLVHLFLRQPAHLQRIGDVPGNGKVREQCVVLEEHADVALEAGDGRDVIAVDEDLSVRAALRSRR